MAADPTTDTYLAARDRFIAANKGKDAPDGVARAGVERLLRAAIPTFTAPGFSAGELNLNCLDDNAAGFSALDGLAFSAGETSVVVSTRTLTTQWLARHNKEFATDRMPGSIPAAFRSGKFWTFTSCPDAAAQLRGQVLVKAPAGTDMAIAQLAVFAQHGASEQDADTLLVAAVRGDRVLLARQKLTVKLDRPAICKTALDQTLAKSAAALKAYQEAIKDQPPGKVKDPSRFNEHLAYEEKANREYPACFAQHLPEQANFAAVQKQAQALVDLLK